MAGLQVDSGYRSSRVLTPSDTVIAPEAMGLGVVATVAGNVSVKLVGGTVMTFPVVVGLTIIPLAVSAVLVTNTTATAVYYGLN